MAGCQLHSNQPPFKSLALSPSGQSAPPHLRLPARAKPLACSAASLGFKEIHAEARPGDVMAGAGGAAGPSLDVRHQHPGKTV